jgi:tetratricopeptide (TPR) repeat protein
MNSSSNPVFLSYASQDEEAAQRICDALRARGIEVWFDQSELRGGDAWDQKIRDQIKECRLFIPIISANTNARAEGYFRLEWKLAVERSRLLADDEPFILPVAIDEFPDAAARVPERFREVQWAHLGAKDTPESIATRVSKLLDGSPLAEASDRKALQGRHVNRRWPRYAWAVFGILVALGFAYRQLWHSDRDAKPASTASSIAPASDAAQLARRALALTTKLNFKTDDLATAADLARKATDLDSSLALAWGARARVEASWLLRNWDLSGSHRLAAQEFAKRGIALDPDEPNALWSQGWVLYSQRAFAEATGVFLHAVKAAPDDPYIRRALAYTYATLERTDEALATYEEALRRDPRDPITHYDLSIFYVGWGAPLNNDPANVDRAITHLDHSLAIRVYPGAIVLKAVLLAAWKDDLAAAVATLDRMSSLPLEDRTQDRIVFVEMWLALLQRKPAHALAAASRTTSPYFVDSIVAEPVAWMKALAHRQSGRESLAAEEWRVAEQTLRAQLEKTPNSLPIQAELAVTLAMLGRKDEAARQFARYDAAMREQDRTGTLRHVRYYAAMGDAKRTAAAIREARKPRPRSELTPVMWVTRAVLARDPWFDSVRGHAEFKALLKE